jgi:hypothetical protein
MDYTFEKFVQDFCKQYHKVQTNEQVYMNLRTINQTLNEWVEEYYECILSLVNYFRQPFSWLNFFTYLHVMIVGEEWDMLIQHLELMVVCEKSSTYVNDNKVILNMHPLMKGDFLKWRNPQLWLVKWWKMNANIVKNLIIQKKNVFGTQIVTTLALGSRPRLRGLQGCGPRGSPGITSRTPGSVRKCEGVNPHTPKATPTWEMESRWTPETSKSDCKGQTSMYCGVLYIIGKLLKRRCLKWARIAHSDIWNTSYGQKKGRESNCQFDSRPQKVKNRPDLLSWRGRATYHWKALDKSYNFTSDRIAIRALFAKLWGSKVAGVPFGAISGLPLGSPGKNSHLDVIWM